MRLKLVVCIAAVALAAPAVAQEAGFYIGGSIGQSKTKIDTQDLGTLLTSEGIGHGSISTDSTDTAWKAILGYRINRNFAIEGGFLDLGKFSAKTTVTSLNGIAIAPQQLTLTLETSNGLHIAALAGVPFGEKFYAYGKLGMYSIKTTLRAAAAGSASTSDTNTGVVWGGGAQYEITPKIGIRAEWERFNDVGSDNTAKGDVDLVSVGVIYRF